MGLSKNVNDSGQIYSLQWKKNLKAPFQLMLGHSDIFYFWVTVHQEVTY